MSRRYRAGWIGLLGAMLGACSDMVRPEIPAGTLRSTAAAAEDDDRPDEAEMLAFARRLPALGGYHFTRDGDLVVSLTDAAQAHGANAMLAGVARRGSGRMHVRPARYSFLQLREWRDAIAEPLMGVAGVTMLDLDEVANQVVVGVAEPGARPAVLELGRRLGIPVPALAFVEGGYPEVMSLEVYAPYTSTTPVQGDSITSYRRPLEGGLQISYRRGVHPDSATKCTLGFTALWNGQRVGVTASHCSLRQWDPDGVGYFQSLPGAARYVGYELLDPNAKSCGFLSINVCRNSDGMLMHLEADVPDNFGYIARPVGPPRSGVSPYGVLVSSLRIDAANPRFRIVAQRAPKGDDVVHKVGVTSGWTSGLMLRTCSDMPADRSYSWLRCQSLAEMSATTGDSGAPVFIDHGDGTVTLVGLLWGIKTENGVRYAAFSSVPQLEKDLGVLQSFPGSGSGGGGGGGGEPGTGPGCDPFCIY